MLSTVRAPARSSGAQTCRGAGHRVSRLNLAAVRLQLASMAAHGSAIRLRARPRGAGDPGRRRCDEHGRGLRATGGPVGAHRPASKPALRTRCWPSCGAPGLRDPHGSVDRRAACPAGGAWRVWLLRADEGRGPDRGAHAAEMSKQDGLMNRLAQLAAVALENVRALERAPDRGDAATQPAARRTAELSGLAIAARYRACNSRRRSAATSSTPSRSGTTSSWSSVTSRAIPRGRGGDGGAGTRCGPTPTTATRPQILARLDSVLGRTAPELTATACIAGRTAEVAAGQCRHLPVVLCRGGATRFLDHHGVLLGVNVGRYDAETVDLPGDRLAFVTDGLAERRTQSLDDRLDWFSDEIAATTGRRRAGGRSPSRRRGRATTTLRS